jgi:hypothetical protein
MYLIDDGDGSAVPTRAHIGDHFAARLHADRVDVELARGASPDADIQSALRSRALTSDRARRDLAHGLRRAMARATAPTADRSAVPGVNSAEIISAVPDLMELHRLLLTDGPVSVRGVAQTRMLLTAGAGPLYSPRTAANVHADVRRAVEALNSLDATMSTHVEKSNPRRQ